MIGIGQGSNSDCKFVNSEQRSLKGNYHAIIVTAIRENRAAASCATETRGKGVSSVSHDEDTRATETSSLVSLFEPHGISLLRQRAFSESPFTVTLAQ